MSEPRPSLMVVEDLQRVRVEWKVARGARAAAELRLLATGQVRLRYRPMASAAWHDARFKVYSELLVKAQLRRWRTVLEDDRHRWGGEALDLLLRTWCRRPKTRQGRATR